MPTKLMKPEPTKEIKSEPGQSISSNISQPQHMSPYSSIYQRHSMGIPSMSREDDIQKYVFETLTGSCSKILFSFF